MKIDFTPRCNLTISEPQHEYVGRNTYLTLGWKRHTPEGDFHHYFAHPVSDPFEPTTAVLTPRSCAYMLLDDLPSEALPEVLEYLAQAWKFWAYPVEPIEPPKTRVLKGKVVRRSERPAYSIPDEE